MAQPAGFDETAKVPKLAGVKRGMLQGTAPTDGKTPGCPPVGMWAKAACLLEGWAPPQDCGEVEVVPKAEELALHEKGNSLEEQSACEAAETGGWRFLSVGKGY